MKIKSFACVALLALVLGGLPATGSAAETKNSGITDTWKWKFTAPSGDVIQNTLKLKLEGDKLAGTYVRGDATESPIEDARFKEGEVSFKISRERNGRKLYSKYEGKLDGDVIKGKMENNFGGETRTSDWLARRDDGKADVAGTWRYSFTTQNGQTFEPTFKLKQDGDTVTGAVTFNENQAPISDGKVKDNEVSFMVIRERDGKTFTSRYRGKVTGNTIKGKVESNYGGVERTFEFEAKRVKE
jgi:hypothetical protein